MSSYDDSSGNIRNRSPNSDNKKRTDNKRRSNTHGGMPMKRLRIQEPEK